MLNGMIEIGGLRFCKECKSEIKLRDSLEQAVRRQLMSDVPTEFYSQVDWILQLPLQLQRNIQK